MNLYIDKQGKPFDVVVEDESTWTIEDRKLIRFQLIKAFHKTKDLCWLSLLEDQYQPDTITLNEMRKKLDLEQFQKEVNFRNTLIDSWVRSI